MCTFKDSSFASQFWNEVRLKTLLFSHEIQLSEMDQIWKLNNWKLLCFDWNHWRYHRIIGHNVIIKNLIWFSSLGVSEKSRESCLKSSKSVSYAHSQCNYSLTRLWVATTSDKQIHSVCHLRHSTIFHSTIILMIDQFDIESKHWKCVLIKMDIKESNSWANAIQRIYYQMNLALCELREIYAGIR